MSPARSMGGLRGGGCGLPAAYRQHSPWTRTVWHRPRPSRRPRQPDRMIVGRRLWQEPGERVRRSGRGARTTPGNGPRTEGAGRAAEVMQVPELIGGASGLGWVAVKAVLLFALAVIGLRWDNDARLPSSARSISQSPSRSARSSAGARPHRTRRSLPRRSRWSPSWSRIASSRSCVGTAGSSA
jgi:hypothetical protein